MNGTSPSLLRRVRYPAIGLPAEPRPELPARVFAARLARVRRAMNRRGLDALVVYGDREHFATLAWLTNYDPRFEESLLVVFPSGRPILWVGNEGLGYSNIARLPVERRLYQTFSLLGQPRDRVAPLSELLRGIGLDRCARVGTAGWKYFSAKEVENPDEALDVPDFIACSLRRVVRAGGRVTNETALFLDAGDGLRNRLEPEQIADFEWVATWNSENLLRGIRALRPGLTEMEAFASMRCAGMPWCCSPVVTAGERLRGWGMGSPTSRVIRRGEPVLMTCAYQGANTCRLGWMARGPRDLPAAARDYVERAAAPYFGALAAWYETLRLGVPGRALDRAVRQRLEPLGFGLALNIGHQIAADEWTHSLVAADSTQRVRSGQYWQADFFATRSSAHFAAFAEDGVVVAHAGLRARIRRGYPAAWRRFQRRRRFLIETLGIAVAEEALPMSNFPAAVIPFLLSPTLCMAKKR